MRQLPDVAAMPLAGAQAACQQAGYRVVVRTTGPPWPSTPAGGQPESGAHGDRVEHVVVRASLLGPEEVELLVAPRDPQRVPPVVPRHVAIICDGNGRWALSRGLPRHEGHRAGTEHVRRVVDWCRELGIEYLSLYAFSTENWNRPRQEVEGLMSLIAEGARQGMEALAQAGVRVRVLGRPEGLPQFVLDIIRRVTELTARNQGMTVNLMLNYGGRADIVDACRKLAEAAMRGAVSPAEIDDKLLSDYLVTAGTPDPDLVIRTAGDLRLSNFLIWQSTYSELHFTPVYWPAFSRGDLLAALDDYSRRQRRFGGLAPEAD